MRLSAPRAGFPDSSSRAAPSAGPISSIWTSTSEHPRAEVRERAFGRVFEAPSPCQPSCRTSGRS